MIFRSVKAFVASKEFVCRKNGNSNRDSKNILECKKENYNRSNYGKFMFSNFGTLFLVGCVYMFLQSGKIYEDTIVSERHWSNGNGRQLAEANPTSGQGGNDGYMGKDFDPYDMTNLEQQNYGTGNTNDLTDLFQGGGDSAYMWGANGNGATGYGEENWDSYYKSAYGNFPPSADNGPASHRADASHNRMSRYGDSSMKNGMMGSITSSLGNIPNESVLGSRASMQSNEADGAAGADGGASSDGADGDAGGSLPGSSNMNEGVLGSKAAAGGSQGEQITDDKYPVFDSLYEEYLGATKGAATLRGVHAKTGGGLGGRWGATVGGTSGNDSDDELSPEARAVLGRAFGKGSGADIGARSRNNFKESSDPYGQFESGAASDSMWSGFQNQYDSFTEPTMSTSVSTNDISPRTMWAHYRQQLENYSDAKDELEESRQEKQFSERSSSSHHRTRSSSGRTSSRSKPKSSLDNRIVKSSAKKGTSRDEYEKRRKDSKMLQRASSKHIMEMIDKLGSTVNMRDMFYIFNCLINHERTKYVDMQEGTMLFWDKTAKSYGIPGCYKNRQWMKAFDGMTKELFYTEKKLFDRLYYLLQTGSCSRRSYIQFLKEVKYTCSRVRKEMDSEWKQYLCSKVAGAW
ncbi:hypothetical protein C922_05683 [Plasmodium inui San Antonio 1]|uniref:Plasmodium RESA N-terminal domain-containing protein n=1 Tax=Plasmodium inui San Antonio 1 TaxID=1237626 RepID=W7A4B0_9APIC|nr:hypothetical protein C922_05683 [Plasmodium inui San Antonio 1]EUD63934.1 hypothetical protein C922_05683 [Plasmodium inui San Antonio 1]